MINESKAQITVKDLDKFTKTIRAFVFDVLGLIETKNYSQTQVLDDVVNMLIKLRDQAREDQNWALSDKIRDELVDYGVHLKHGTDGTTFSVN